MSARCGAGAAFAIRIRGGSKGWVVWFTALLFGWLFGPGRALANGRANTTDTTHVFVNRKKVELDTADLTGAELLEKAGFTGQQWDLLKLQGEGDPTGGELIMFDQRLTLKNGDRFRVIPGNRTFGAQ